MKQIVIELSDELYKEIASEDAVYYPDDGGVVWQAVREGTVLPDNHGRLIDANRTALLSDLFCYTKYTGIDEAPYEDATKALDFAPTILEAKEQSE